MAREPYRSMSAICTTCNEESSDKKPEYYDSENA
jgi:hypothetical protein